MRLPDGKQFREKHFDEVYPQLLVGDLFCVPRASSQAAAGYDRGSVVIWNLS